MKRVLRITLGYAGMAAVYGLLSVYGSLGHHEGNDGWDDAIVLGVSFVVIVLLLDVVPRWRRRQRDD